ncbi:hypothetical protein [Kitasatospora sp. GP82]|uniref:hypothetical protein n=1 Tax=Kitasatospora sp. GP82 TaxID=3035089 RepID=UPI0024771D5A|nr:hypothetical protein [Kitasatospora sp. GP82]MDH6130522.1 hypothetical protein [Kitasatospora sp. GP82]
MAPPDAAAASPGQERGSICAVPCSLSRTALLPVFGVYRPNFAVPGLRPDGLRQGHELGQALGLEPGQPLLGLFDPGCAAVEPVEPLGVCRSTLWNAINDVLPVLDDHRLAITPAEHHYATAADALAATRAPDPQTTVLFFDGFS